MEKETKIGRLLFLTYTDRENKLVKRLKSLSYEYKKENVYDQEEKQEIFEECEKILYCMYLMGLIDVETTRATSDLFKEPYFY